jgi:hypothetical protein
MDTHIFDLIYNEASETVIGKREDVRPMKIGDMVIFQSAAGAVHVKLAPVDVFGVGEFHQGDQPLEVKKLAKFQYWCGVVWGGKAIGWPLNEKFGNKEDTGTP